MINSRLLESLVGNVPLTQEVARLLDNKEFLDHLKTVSSCRRFNGRHLLVSEDQVAEHICLLEAGVARSFYFDERSGREVTEIIFGGMSLVVEPVSFFLRQRSQVSIEVSGGSLVHLLSYRRLLQLYERFPISEVLVGHITLKYITLAYQRRLQFSSMDAWQRYLLLLKQFPDIELCVSKETIASYLNIAPPSLSRLLRQHRHP